MIAVSRRDAALRRRTQHMSDEMGQEGPRGPFDALNRRRPLRFTVEETWVEA
jgi:hypothetical protein